MKEEMLYPSVEQTPGGGRREARWVQVLGQQSPPRQIQGKGAPREAPNCKGGTGDDAGQPRTCHQYPQCPALQEEWPGG